MHYSLLAGRSRVTSVVFRVHGIDRPAAVVTAAAIVYGVAWSLISISKLNTYHATVFDLGVSSFLLWSVFHGHFVLVPEKSVYLLLAPFYYLYPRQAALLVFQSFWIGAGSLPLYFIAKRVTGSNGALAVSMGYLLYFPVAGINWFDFHFMALFPTLFLTGLYFRMSGRVLPSAVFLALSCTTDALAPAIVAIAGCILTYDDWRIGRGRTALFPRDNRRIPMRYDAAVVMLPVLFLAGLAAAFGPDTLLKYIPFRLSLQGAATAFSFDLPWKVYFLALPILPLVVFIRRSPVFLLLSVPYSLFALFSTDLNNFTPYYYQYAALYAPGYVLAALLGMAGMSDRKFRIIRRKRISAKPATVFLALVLIAGAFLLPYSPLNAYMARPPEGNYLFLHNVLPNRVDRNLTEMLELIPSNASVLMQNNMPELAQRSNFTVPGVYKGNYLPAYIVTDPHSRFFYVNMNGSTKGDMLYWINRLFSTGHYGIIAEAGNCILARRGYTGPVEYFVPYATSRSVTGTGATDTSFQMYLANGVYELNLTGPHSAVAHLTLNVAHFNNDRSGTAGFVNGTSVTLSVQSGSVYSLVSIALTPGTTPASFAVSITQTGIQHGRATS